MKEFTPVFKNKNFLYIWSSQILSQFSINVMNFLVLVYLFESTGSTIASSFIWVAYAIPALTFGPLAAAAVDMYDKRKIMIIANFSQALVILIYAIVFERYLYLSYGVVLGYSLFDQLYVPSETASVAAVVSKKRLPQANGLFFLSQQGAAILGFGMAGVIVEIMGFRNTILLGTIMNFIAALVCSRLPRIKSDRTKATKSWEQKVIRFFSRIYEGYSFIRHRRTILMPFLFLMWLQVSLAILVVNLPAIGTQILKTKPSLAGILTVGPGGIGTLFGTLLVTRYISKKASKKKIVEYALLAMFITFIASSLITPFLPFWAGRVVLVLSFFGIGIAYVSSLIPTLTYLQINTPRKLMGRVFGNFWFLTTIATMFPVLFSATITELLGVNVLLIVVGSIAGVMFVLSRFYFSKLFARAKMEGEIHEIPLQ